MSAILSSLTSIRDNVFGVFDALHSHVRRTLLQGDYTVSTAVDNISDEIRDAALFVVGAVFSVAGLVVNTLFTTTRVVLGAVLGFPTIQIEIVETTTTTKRTKKGSK